IEYDHKIWRKHVKLPVQTRFVKHFFTANGRLACPSNPGEKHVLQECKSSSIIDLRTYQIAKNDISNRGDMPRSDDVGPRTTPCRASRGTDQSPRAVPRDSLDSPGKQLLLFRKLHFRLVPVTAFRQDSRLGDLVGRVGVAVLAPLQLRQHVKTLDNAAK